MLASPLRRLLFIMFLFVAGCEPPPPLSTETSVATRQANKLLPRGMREEHATRILQSKGFTVSRLNSDTSANHLLVASYARDKYSWLVGVVIVEGKVVACSVTVTRPREAAPSPARDG